MVFNRVHDKYVQVFMLINVQNLDIYFIFVNDFFTNEYCTLCQDWELNCRWEV